MDTDNDLAQGTTAQATAPLIEARVDPAIEFDEFFRQHYRNMIRNAMYAGATKEEAEDAVSDAMLGMLGRWCTLSNPVAYARRAVLNSFVKVRQRERRRAELLAAEPKPSVHGEDAGLTLWEDRQWVAQLLNSLPERQREVMALVVDGIEPRDIAELLGRSAAAVRQNLLEARKRLRPMTGQGNTERDAASVRKEA